MNGLPYYKAYPRDFIDGTVGMPFELKGAYRLVLDLIYMQGGKLPDDARYIAGALGCSVRAWKKYRAALVEMGKLTCEAGIISNFRADKELETLAKLQDKQRENASGPRKIKEIEKPRPRHTDTDTDTEDNTNVLSKPRKRASRLPADWRLPDDLREWALSEGWPPDMIDAEAVKMRDWSASSKNGAKLDWGATWRNWMRDKPKGGAHGKSYTTERTAAETARLDRLLEVGKRRDAQRGSAGNGDPGERRMAGGPGDDASPPLLRLTGG